MLSRHLLRHSCCLLHHCALPNLILLQRLLIQKLVVQNRDLNRKLRKSLRVSSHRLLAQLVVLDPPCLIKLPQGPLELLIGFGRVLWRRVFDDDLFGPMSRPYRGGATEHDDCDWSEACSVRRSPDV